VGEHLLAALLAEGIEALAAELQQLVALGVAQLLAAHQGVGAPLAAGDAVAGEHFAHHALHAFGVVVDLGHVFPQDPPGHVLRRGRAAAAQQLQPLLGSLRLQHQRLVDVAHAHALGDGVPQALVGGGGGRGHGGMLATPGRLIQVWLWAARQAGPPAGIPSGEGAPWLQPNLHRA